METMIFTSLNIQVLASTQKDFQDIEFILKNKEKYREAENQYIFYYPIR